jgi:hypothetical protein
MKTCFFSKDTYDSNRSTWHPREISSQNAIQQGNKQIQKNTVLVNRFRRTFFLNLC